MVELNSCKNIFFIGIGGIGMSALAIILKERGFNITGSDRAESSTTKQLVKAGIQVTIGHNAENIHDSIDLIVYTSAISEDNPEFCAARQKGKKVLERASMLDIMAKSKYSIGVSGTHGKTTTTSMISKIFLNAGMEPTLAVGGFIKEINGSGYEGKGKYFIYEACEAYESFLKLHPNVAVITNIDADHLDYYGSFENIKLAFTRYIAENIPSYGMVIYNRDDQPLRGVIDSMKLTNSISVGINTPGCDFHAEDVTLYEFSSSFLVKNRGKTIGEFFVNIPGIHNVYNALLAIAACKINGINVESIRKTLSNFKNADRRFQLKFDSSHLMVIDDYAHHPSEIDATLNAAKNLSERKHAQLIAVFQPHLYSRTEFLYKDFAKSLCKADRVVLTEIYAARELNVNNISSQIIFDEVVKLIGKDNVVYSKELNEVPENIKPLMNDNNIIITLGAGDVWKVSDMFGTNKQ